VARRFNSTALAARCVSLRFGHLSTLAVLAGLLLSWLGGQLHISWLSYADPVAAIMVSLLILRLSWKTHARDFRCVAGMRLPAIFAGRLSAR